MAHITADALEARAGADKLLEVELDGGAEEDATALTVRFVDEDHTLGNSLRYVLMRNAGVGFCGRLLAPGLALAGVELDCAVPRALPALRLSLGGSVGELCHTCVRQKQASTAGVHTRPRQVSPTDGRCTKWVAGAGPHQLGPTWVAQG